MTETTAARTPLLRRGLRLEYLTIGWNIPEGLVAVTAALAAGSIALLGFGVDSFVECASGGFGRSGARWARKQSSASIVGRTGSWAHR